MARLGFQYMLKSSQTLLNFWVRSQQKHRKKERKSTMYHLIDSGRDKIHKKQWMGLTNNKILLNSVHEVLGQTAK